MSVDSRASHSEHSHRRGRSRDKKPKDAHSNNDRSLYVTNISSHCSTTYLQELFEKYGPVENFQMIQHPVTRQPRGFGFVLYIHPEDADLAIKNLNGKEIEGRRLRVEIAKRDRPHDPTPGYYRGPPGASIKYDVRGRLKPGFLPYYELKPSRNGRSPERERGYPRRSRSYGYSPRRVTLHADYDTHYKKRSYSPYTPNREPNDSYPRYRSRSREGEPNDSNPRYRPRSRESEQREYYHRYRSRSRDGHRVPSRVGGSREYYYERERERSPHSKHRHR